MASLPLFFYGTLTDRGVRERVLGRRELACVPARLANYERVSKPDYPYPFVAPAAGGLVDGLALLGLTAADYAILDEYEDVAEGTYERVRVEIELLQDGPRRTVPAWVYAQGPGSEKTTPEV